MSGPVPSDDPVPPSDRSGRLIVACLRVNDLRPLVDPLDGSVSRDPLGVGLTPADAAALEHALRLADGGVDRVVAVTVGPPSVEPVLREVAALGVDVVRVPADDEGDGHRYAAELAQDERGLARVIASAVRPFGVPDLVLCGDRSGDRGTGALPAYLAHEFGASQALGLVGLCAEAPGVLLVERRLDGGWRERLRVRLPAVCSVEGAGVRLRRASLSGALAADRPVTAVDHGSGGDEPPGAGTGAPPLHIDGTRPFTPRTRTVPPPVGDDPRLRLLALTGALVAHEPPVVVHPSDAGEAADVLLAFLARHGYAGDDGAAPSDGGTP
jgi:electron transfer flavoprotein beta subunit